MHQIALKGLDVEDVRVERYTLPNRWWQWCLGVAVALTMTTFPFRDQLHPDSGSIISQIWSIGGLVPMNAVLAYKLSPVVWPLTMVVHLGEAGYMAWGRLRKHQVEMFSKVWWMWVADNFVEGFGAWRRFDEVVEGLREEQARRGPKGRH